MIILSLKYEIIKLLFLNNYFGYFYYQFQYAFYYNIKYLIYNIKNIKNKLKLLIKN